MKINKNTQKMSTVCCYGTKLGPCGSNISMQYIFLTVLQYFSVSPIEISDVVAVIRYQVEKELYQILSTNQKIFIAHRDLVEMF